MMRNRITAVVCALGVLGVGQAVLSPAASAAVPSCVRATEWKEGSRTYVRITNNCTTTQSFVIRWNNAWDSHCLTLARGATITRSKLWSDFRGLKDC
ncbi:MAG: hypothetical protein ABW022_08270 [Actinoplanes sp.]